MNLNWIGLIKLTTENHISDATGTAMADFLSCDGATIAQADRPVLYQELLTQTTSEANAALVEGQRMLLQQSSGGAVDSQTPQSYRFWEPTVPDWPTRYGETYRDNTSEASKLAFIKHVASNGAPKAEVLLPYKQDHTWFFRTGMNAGASTHFANGGIQILQNDVEVLAVYFSRSGYNGVTTLYLRQDGDTLLDNAGTTYDARVFMSMPDRNTIVANIQGKSAQTIVVPVDMSAANVSIVAFAEQTGGYPGYTYVSLAEEHEEKAALRTVNLPDLAPPLKVEMSRPFKILADKL